MVDLTRHGGLPSRVQDVTLSVWEWRADGLWFLGATQDTQIRLRYLKAYPDFTDATSPVLVRNCPGSAGVCHGGIGGMGQGQPAGGEVGRRGKRCDRGPGSSGSPPRAAERAEEAAVFGEKRLHAVLRQFSVVSFGFQVRRFRCKEGWQVRRISDISDQISGSKELIEYPWGKFGERFTTIGRKRDRYGDYDFVECAECGLEREQLCVCVGVVDIFRELRDRRGHAGFHAECRTNCRRTRIVQVFAESQNGNAGYYMPIQGTALNNWKLKAFIAGGTEVIGGGISGERDDGYRAVEYYCAEVVVGRQGTGSEISAIRYQGAKSRRVAALERRSPPFA